MIWHSVRSPEGWAAARAALERVLVNAARERRTVTYSDVALHAFDGRVPARSRLIMDLLSEVDRDFELAHGIVIASLVVRRDSGIPGEGYFAFLASNFGVDVSDPETAWREQAEKVWRYFEDERHGR